MIVRGRQGVGELTAWQRHKAGSLSQLNGGEFTAYRLQTNLTHCLHYAFRKFILPILQLTGFTLKLFNLP